MEKDRMAYAKKIKEYMVKNGLNQQMFADQVGCVVQTVSRWYRGENAPAGELRKKVDAILDGNKKEGEEATMNEKEVSLAKNGSGYYDPTAHNAFKNIISESKPVCLRGDIYTVELKNMSTERKVLVIGNDCRKTDRWISVLILQDEEKGKNVVPIVAGSAMYVDCDRVTYIDRNNVLNFVRSATDEEMARIDEAICESLGISAGDAELYSKLQEAEAMRDDFKAAYGIMHNEYLAIKEKCDFLEKQPVFETSTDEVVKLKAMIDVYKEQNEMLLEKLIG